MVRTIDTLVDQSRKLYPLEVKATGVVTPDELEAAKSMTIDEEIPSSDDDRPTRAAAENGILIRRLLGQE